MSKLVSESLDDFFKSNNINEGIWSNVKGAIQKLFKKIGDFFVSKYKDGNGYVPAMSPVNIGIMKQKGLLPEGVEFYPSQACIDLEPSLKTLRDKKSFLASIKEWPSFLKYKKNKTNESLNEDLIDQKHWDPDMPNIDEPQLMRRLRMVLMGRAKAVPLLIWGSIGIAKTGIVETVLKAVGTNGSVIKLPLTTMRRDDWFLPNFVQQQFSSYGGELRAEDIPKTWLPVYKKTGDPKKDAEGNDRANLGDGGIIFLDELSRADKEVLQTLLTFVHERHVGEWYLGDKWCLVSASNRRDDDPTQPYSASTALANRFSQVNFVLDYKYWRQWATKQPISSGRKYPIGTWKKMIGDMKVDPRIITFLDFNSEYAYQVDTEKSIFRTYRTWEMASKLINDAIDEEAESKEGLSQEELTNIVGSAIGIGAATEFMTFMHLLTQFTVEDIKKVLTDPNNAKLPTKSAESTAEKKGKGKGYDLIEAKALLTVVCTYTKEHPITPEQWNNYNVYLTRLDNSAVATTGHKMMIFVNPIINQELGEVDDPKTGKKRDKFQKGYDIFVAKYGKYF